MKRLETAAVVTLAFCVIGASQSSSSSVTLRSVSRLVQITVVAEAGHGHPVTDLKRDDFLLFDSGQQREIKVFTVDRADREHTAAAVTAPSQPSGSGNVFTNAGLERSGPTSVTVIVLDSLNTQWTDQSRAARGVIRYLSKIHPEDHVAIYSISLTGFRVLHDFTTDASDLVTRLASWHGEIPRADSPDMGDQLESVLTGTSTSDVVNQTLAPSGDSRGMGATMPTLRVMQLLANRLAGIPGRKNVIWISNSFPAIKWGNEAQTVLSHGSAPVLVRSLDPRNNANTVTDTAGDVHQFSDEVAHAMHLLDSANVSIYPVETRGLQTYMPGMTGAMGGRSRRDTGTTTAVFSDHSTEQTMQDIAKRTGGRAFTSTNDVFGAIRSAVNDSRVTYTLGFYPTSTLQDGRFHPIKIKLAKRHGITLRYRQGYIDAPDEPSDPKQRKNALEQAALSPLDANAIPLTAHLQPSGVRMSYNLDVMIGVGGLNLEPDGDLWSGEVDVMLVQRDQRGQEFDRVNSTIEMRLKQTTYNKLLKTGLPYERVITVNPKANVLRVVVRDARSGDLGSLTIPTAKLMR